MAIVKGKRLYQSGKLAAVHDENPQAVAEYAWLMAGVGDDWGRFKLSPRAILGDAYEQRNEVTEEMVSRWLALYEKHGLLTLYLAEGAVWAEWTNYMGAAESQRRYHRCPDSPGSSHTHRRSCRFVETAMLARKSKGRSTPIHKDRHIPSTCSAVPAVLRIPPVTNTPPTPPADAGGPFDLPPDLEHTGPGGNGHGRREVTARAEAARVYAVEIGFRPTRRDRREMRQWVLMGYQIDRIRSELDAMKAEGRSIAPLPPRRR
jgi:hypothetical protein